MLAEMFPGQDPQRHVTSLRIGSNAALFPAGAILRSLGSFREPDLGRTKLAEMIKAICEWMLSFSRRIKQPSSALVGCLTERQICHCSGHSFGQIGS
jgi:hypothetical protein